MILTYYVHMENCDAYKFLSRLLFPSLGIFELV